MAKKNYNRLALNGMKVTDMELVREYGLNPEVANTPAINDAMLNKIEQNNIRDMINDGMSESKAKAEAGKLKAKAKSNIIKEMNRKV